MPASDALWVLFDASHLGLQRLYSYGYLSILTAGISMDQDLGYVTADRKLSGTAALLVVLPPASCQPYSLTCSQPKVVENALQLYSTLCGLEAPATLA